LSDLNECVIANSLVERITLLNECVGLWVLKKSSLVVDLRDAWLA
jgi:hypothetical protein